MLGQPIVRDLELADIYSREGFVECLRELSNIELSKEAMEKLYYDRQHEGIRTLVAVADNLVVGTATLLVETKFIHNGGKVGHIEDVAVHPSFQGNGIGKMLIKEIIEIARKAKCYKLLLDCDDGVVTFYEQFGFRKMSNNMRLDLE